MGINNSQPPRGRRSGGQQHASRQPRLSQTSVLQSTAGYAAPSPQDQTFGQLCDAAGESCQASRNSRVSLRAVETEVPDKFLRPKQKHIRFVPQDRDGTGSHCPFKVNFGQRNSTQGLTGSKTGTIEKKPELGEPGSNSTASGSTSTSASASNTEKHRGTDKPRTYGQLAVQVKCRHVIISNVRVSRNEEAKVKIGERANRQVAGPAMLSKMLGPEGAYWKEGELTEEEPRRMEKRGTEPTIQMDESEERPRTSRLAGKPPLYGQKTQPPTKVVTVSKETMMRIKKRRLALQRASVVETIVPLTERIKSWTKPTPENV